MTPNIKDNGGLQAEVAMESLKPQTAAPIKHKIIYFNILYFGYWHLAASYGIYLCFTSVKWQTLLFGFIVYQLAQLGITAGSHRLWSHKCYKAKMPLQILLMVLNSIAFQTTVIHWARDHRLHHKYSDTDADPHNSSRGFFYAHMGWMLTKKNQEVVKRGKSLEVSDLYNNPVLRFQKKYAVPVFGTLCFILPTALPMYFWGESFNNSWHANLLRYTINMNITLLVNSVAHVWGYRPYDKEINPAQNLYISFVTLGEGFHNYHHVFPWDYRTAELGNNKLNLTTHFIDVMAKIGWAYDLKAASNDMIKARVSKTGDGTGLWGWDDKDMTENDKKCTKLL